jgi:hypothetical protein
MRVRTLLRYLIGDRAAILQLASDRRALGASFLFVLSAGFAREYDGEDLLHEPWHLLLPVVASLFSSFLLFTAAYGVALLKRAPGPTFFSAYRSFLSLFWLTAPLAWLYAVPYERFLSATDAVRANLLTLALVSVWRIALMTRVVSVLMGYRAGAAFVLVMAYADVVALTLLWFVPLPIIQIMGGVRLSEAEKLLLDVELSVGFLGWCSLPFWLILAVTAAAAGSPAWHAAPSSSEAGSSRTAWGLALGSVAVWTLILPFTQPEQQLRGRVERRLKDGEVAEALVEMSAHSQTDFPPYWVPPPREAYGERLPPLIDVLEVMAEKPPAPWVRALYLQRLRDLFQSWDYHWNDDQIADRLAYVLARLPEGRTIFEKLDDERWTPVANRVKELLDAQERDRRGEKEQR